MPSSLHDSMEDDSDSASIALYVGSEWLRGGANGCAELPQQINLAVTADPRPVLQYNSNRLYSLR